jgi:hypothetical protein
MSLIHWVPWVEIIVSLVSGLMVVYMRARGRGEGELVAFRCLRLIFLGEKNCGP